MKFVSAVKWIKQGVAKATPEKVALTKEELKRMLDVAKAGKNENGTGEDENTEVSNSQVNDKETDEYDWEHYDEDKVDDATAGLAGLTVFSSNDEDPYMNSEDNDDDDDSDTEDFHIRPDDNLLLTTQIAGTSAVLKFYVYNKKDEDFYVHHDIWLSSPPFCVEYLQIEGENLVAVGGMDPAIDVWDLDIADVLEPHFVLGKRKKSSSKRGHKDAVLDLAWNKNYEKVLASASADHTVALWDVNSGDVVTFLQSFTDKVQSLAWHPYESQHLLAGSCGGAANFFDCRNPKEVSMKWDCDGDVEKVIWNHFSPFYCLASTEKGIVSYYDVRSDKPVWTLSAHTNECTGLALSSQCPDLLVTSSMDEDMKVWDISGEPSFVYTHKPKLGRIFCLDSCPDNPFVFCCGGDRKGTNIKVVDFMEYAAVQKKFEGRSLVHSVNADTNEDTTTEETNLPKNKKRKMV